MSQYWMARCPARGVFESDEYKRAQDLQEDIKAIHAKAKKRWENNF